MVSQKPVKNIYVEYILEVIRILDHFSQKTCQKSDALEIYIYLTPFNKVLPKIGAIDADNINTGINMKDQVCSGHESINEITVYREEDWFKVFIHEAIHSFRIDFPQEAQKEIHSIFAVKTQGNLFEGYTEFWAGMINMMFCSMILEKRGKFSNVMEIMGNLIHVEKMFGFFQVVKIAPE